MPSRRPVVIKRLQIHPGDESPRSSTKLSSRPEEPLWANTLEIINPIAPCIAVPIQGLQDYFAVGAKLEILLEPKHNQF